MDAIGLFIARLHNLLGHDTAAAFMGVLAGDRAACLLCQYERRPTEEGRQAVMAAIGGQS